MAGGLNVFGRHIRKSREAGSQKIDVLIVAAVREGCWVVQLEIGIDWKKGRQEGFVLESTTGYGTAVVTAAESGTGVAAYVASAAVAVEETFVAVGLVAVEDLVLYRPG